MGFLRKLFGSKQSGTSTSSDQPSEIVSKAKKVSWSNQEDFVNLKKAIKNTWNVDCQVLNISEQQAKTLAQQTPLDTEFREVNEQYYIKLSANSIFVHAYGAFIDLGYALFLYHGNLYYVNVEPTVQLTTALFNRTDALDHMAKIMITLNKHIGTQRKTLLICLEGDLSQ